MSLRTTPEALLHPVRKRWSIERWHWIRDTQLHVDAHRYRGNGAGAMATLRTAAMNLLRVAYAHQPSQPRCNDALICSIKPPGVRIRGVTSFLKAGAGGQPGNVQALDSIGHESRSQFVQDLYLPYEINTII